MSRHSAKSIGLLMDMRHAYARKIRRLAIDGKLDHLPAVGVSLLTVRHDGWCGVYKHPEQFCDCDPDVIVPESA